MLVDLQFTKMTTINPVGFKDPIKHQFTKNVLEWQIVGYLNSKGITNKKKHTHKFSVNQ